ncbi:Late embryogenesis abundant protein, LEA-14 [Corchorus capsularis]|uniref:Late embryogenesis abundant protein, LEA-14 n=1 Tax=Corchorus capsularis TaxID=210143 RepID=A0A1R3JHF1_COCAP|nr:Late embryogenesis abundant protein, LEA-14 [Corchorus capsularis]
MADQQRIHPVGDVEAPAPAPPQTVSQTAPLVPHGTSKSDQKYPAFHRTYPAMDSKPPKKKRSCLCKCLCWTISLLLLLILVLGILVGLFFLVFQPKLPKYSIDNLQITQFSPSSVDSSVSAAFDVTITARNPNEKIGIYYEGGSHISAYYTETELCQGSMPKFYQGHENTTVLLLPLTGRIENGTAVLTAVQEQQQQTGNIPLRVRVKQPVRIKVGKLKLFKVKFLVKCGLVVDALSANNAISIQSSSCSFTLKL